MGIRELRRLVWALALCAACQSRYTVQQTSLVPPAIVTPAPAARPGADFALLGSYVTGVRDRPWQKHASVWTARGYSVGTFEYGFRRAGVRLTGFGAPGRGAVAGEGKVMPNPGGTTWGGGPGALIRLLAPTSRHGLVLTTDLWLAIAPSRVQSECIDECNRTSGGGAYTDRSAAVMTTVGLSYRHRLIDALALTSSFAFQTLVTNDETRRDSVIAGRSKVRMGAPHPLFDLGIEWTPIPWVSVSPLVGWIAPPSPSLYLPTVSLVLRAHQEKQAGTASP